MRVSHTLRHPIDDVRFVRSHARPSSDTASVHPRAASLLLIDWSVANVSVHASLPKKDILAFNVTQEYTRN